MGSGRLRPPDPNSPPASTCIILFSKNNHKYAYILVGGIFFRGFCERSSWIFEFLVVVRATFSVGQRIWVQ